MSMPEILAPAGSPEALLAALRCGADAVYVGGKQFSARQSAENFDGAALKEAADLCHLYGAKLYLTVNTLVFDREFDALDAWIREAAGCGIDAFLVQDLGVLALIQEIAPDVPVHASTQMTIHTKAGVEWAKRQGFSRVVVSREMSRKELAPLCQCGIEIEHFVHGALCMSVSGQCSLSAMIGSRSANRGRCAQACRLPFSATGKAGVCALSLKDLCLVPYMQQLMADGVASLKIEGRRKRPEYVAAAVTALVQARDGVEPDLETLRAAFSRSGFTDGYYTGKRRNMFGTRQKEDVLQMQKVLPALEKLYQKPTGRVPLTMHVTVQEGCPVRLRLSDPDGNQAEVTGDCPQPARTRPTDSAQLQRQLEKLGGTIYTLKALTADCDGISMLPASAWNAVRRSSAEAMNRRRIQKNTPVYALRPASKPAPAQETAPAHPLFRVQVAHAEKAAKLLACEDVEAVLLPLTALPEHWDLSSKERVYLTLPRYCPSEDKLAEQLEQAVQHGFRHLVCENVAHLLLGETLGMTLHGGLGLNAANCRCLTFLRQQKLADTMLSPELTAAQIRHCHGLPFGLYAYGNLPVMTMRNCPIQNEVGCKNCTGTLTDRTGRKFPVSCDKCHGVVTMYNAVPTWMADKPEALEHAAFWLLDCTCAENPFAILEAFRQSSAAPFPVTRGLYFRGVE